MLPLRLPYVCTVSTNARQRRHPRHLAEQDGVLGLVQPIRNPNIYGKVCHGIPDPVAFAAAIERDGKDSVERYYLSSAIIRQE